MIHSSTIVKDHKDLRSLFEGAYRLTTEHLAQASATATLDDKQGSGRLYWLCLQAEVLKRNCQFDEAQSYLQQALRHAEMKALPELQCRVLYCLADVRGYLNKFDEAAACLKETLQIASENRFRSHEALAMVALSRIYWHQGNNLEAITLLEQARPQFDLLDQPYLKVHALLALGNQIASSGDKMGVVELHEQALELVLKHEYFIMLPSVLFARGHRQLSEEPFDRAEETFRELLRVAPLYHNWYIPKAWWGLSWSAIRSERWEDAIAHLNTCRSQVLNSPHFVADVDSTLATCYLKLGQYDRALALLEGMVVEESYLSWQYFQALAEAHQAAGRVDTALSFAFKALSMSAIQASPIERHKLVSMQIDIAKERIERAHQAERERRQQLQARLLNTTANLIEKTQLLNTFREELRSLLSKVDDPRKIMVEIKEKLRSFASDQLDWAKFEEEFRSVHPEFRNQLQFNYPALTRAEIRICQLVRLGMKSYEIATLACLSERSVENHRFNIRKKLGLSKEQSLTKVLQEIK